MSGETDLVKLYSNRILALATDIPYQERLSNPSASVKKRAPLCGSTVTVDVGVKDGRIAEFGQDVKACALGQASASIVGRAVIGCDRDQIHAARDALKAMLKQDGPTPPAPFEELEVLRPAQEYKNRHASILLTLDALSDAMDEVAQSDCA
ncbi:iron-sulfur cluster assembly scaffold protein [Pseudooceanicola atlanticus]|uniref:Nitrogen fixation protein NifU n=1 Tax=Pseudooceanicola atlanticus TaxID=1461694 RepID=A0A0A0ECU4_9RHOB|nr:iron-sulfur cluster assembly scaffold protein [Pseudooceanicola atlanticus]KGM47878.1 nitrogen fixation protein NifU [Pseudooceanicola atlanticus]